MGHRFRPMTGNKTLGTCVAAKNRTVVNEHGLFSFLGRGNRGAHSGLSSANNGHIKRKFHFMPPD
jgi:hypothetical protein